MSETDSRLASLQHEKQRLERVISQREKQIEQARFQLRSKLKQIGVPAPRNPEDATISRTRMLQRGQHHALPFYQQAQSVQTTIETRKRELERYKTQLQSIKVEIEQLEDTE